MNLSLKNVMFSGFAAWIAALLIGLYLIMPLREHINLGIDLVGGTYITLEVQTDKAVEAELLDKTDWANARLKEARKALPTAHDVKANTLILSFASAADAQSAVQSLKDPGLNVASQGHTVHISFTDQKIKRIKEDAVERNIEVLRTRLDRMSVAEINIAAHGDKNIVVELPDVSDPQQAKAMIGTAAVLDFRLVEKSGRTPEDILQEYNGHMPAGMEILPDKRSDQTGKPREYYLVSKRASVSGKDLKDARPQFDDQRGQMAVSFTFSPEGGQKFYELTSKNYRRLLAAILDGVVVTAATIEAAISTSGQIHGSFSPDEAKELAVLLKSGSFVAPVTFEEERQVGPLLGAESIRQGIIACLVGLGLLFLFSVLFYRVAGLFAFMALLYNLFLVLLGLSWLGATLTLPGIAGIVLTIGMAVDASILIYESMREDLASGMPLKKAVQAGFADALRVILDSNITTFIVGAVLYKFGTGPIQGFAVTMMLGIISTLLTGLFFLKSLLLFAADTLHVKKLRI